MGVAKVFDFEDVEEKEGVVEEEIEEEDEPKVEKEGPEGVVEVEGEVEVARVNPLLPANPVPNDDLKDDGVEEIAEELPKAEEKGVEVGPAACWVGLEPTELNAVVVELGAPVLGSEANENEVPPDFPGLLEEEKDGVVPPDPREVPPDEKEVPPDPREVPDPRVNPLIESFAEFLQK